MKKTGLLIRICKYVLMAVLAVVVIFAAQKRFENTKRVEFKDHLNDVAFTINGEDVLFSDLAFYVLYEECTVEKQARIYNPQSSKDFWNLHTNDSFIQEQAKDAIIDMAIHDRLYYQLAVAEGITLNQEEEQKLQNSITDFWEDLFDEQIDNLPATREEIENQMRILCIAEKYQNQLAEEKGPSVASWKFDGYYYKQFLETQDLLVNEKIWDRIVVGDITLVHDKVNYVNGHNAQ